MVVLSLSLTKASHYKLTTLWLRNMAQITGEHHWLLPLLPRCMNTINVQGLEAKGIMRSWRNFSLTLNPFQSHLTWQAGHFPPTQMPHLDTISSMFLLTWSCPGSTTTFGGQRQRTLRCCWTGPERLPSWVLLLQGDFHRKNEWGNKSHNVGQERWKERGDFWWILALLVFYHLDLKSNIGFPHQDSWSPISQLQ